MKKAVVLSAYVQLMAEYNEWMNGKLYELCATLPDEERKRDSGAFFRSIHGTLNHILWGDRAWLARFEARPQPIGKAGEDLYSDFEELRAARRAMDADISAWAQRVSPEWLAGDFTWTRIVDRKTYTRPAWVLAVHMFNHQTHHRGQVTTLMKQAGVDPGVTDLPWMPRFTSLE
jgi:uncharacterized damage-inducible protein DinB